MKISKSESGDLVQFEQSCAKVKAETPSMDFCHEFWNKRKGVQLVPFPPRISQTLDQKRNAILNLKRKDLEHFHLVRKETKDRKHTATGSSFMRCRSSRKAKTLCIVRNGRIQWSLGSQTVTRLSSKKVFCFL